MDTALIVFTVGTAASFVPLYWLALRLSARWKRPRTRPQVALVRAEQSGRREFLELLRREAATRAVAVLHEALEEARVATDREGGGAGLSAEMRKSLAETGRLVDSLFQDELREKFSAGAEALAAATPRTISAASVVSNSAIVAFEVSLAPRARKPSAPERRVGSGRGWSAGGARAAA